MISLEKGRLKGPCSLLEMVSTRGYSLLLLGLVDIPVMNVYHDCNGIGELYKPFVIYAGPTSGVYLRVPKPLTSTPLDALLSLPLAYWLIVFVRKPFTFTSTPLDALLPCRWKPCYPVRLLPCSFLLGQS